MNDYLRRAMEMMEAARPASGYRPESDEEWEKLLRATEEFSYALYREAGMPKPKARALAHLMHSGAAGMALLRAAYEVRRDA
jgi:hypothetical protein